MIMEMKVILYILIFLCEVNGIMEILTLTFTFLLKEKLDEI